ncbi:MAG: hypothetical protein U1B79_00935 [Candidatus Pacearchaeota archaeon]|nr:hypothetical protein [Nanoarchaeota archaeon]MDZ4226655.1 hypothetical protein [Candidatus Pacearchaeota archaeon]
MRRKIIGMFSIILGTIIILDSLPGITGNIISEQTGLNLISFFGLIFLVCGLALFFLEARETIGKQEN